MLLPDPNRRGVPRPGGEICMSKRLPRLGSFLWIPALFLGASTAHAQIAKTPPDLKPVLDGNAAAWKISHLQGTNPDHTLLQEQGSQAVVVGANGLSLTSAAPIGGGTEVRVRLRLTSPQDRGTTVHAFAGMK